MAVAFSLFRARVMIVRDGNKLDWNNDVVGDAFLCFVAE
jgi:hypothetical protein